MRYEVGGKREFRQLDDGEVIFLCPAGTSIGANLEESRGAQSSPDFQAKISIAYKEARETSYWLRLLFASKYLTERQLNSLHTDCEELIRILGSAQLTMRTKIQKGL